MDSQDLLNAAKPPIGPELVGLLGSFHCSVLGLEPWKMHKMEVQKDLHKHPHKHPHNMLLSQVAHVLRHVEKAPDSVNSG